MNRDAAAKTQNEKLRQRRSKVAISVEHVDIIKDQFWRRRPWLLAGDPIK